MYHGIKTRRDPDAWGLLLPVLPVYQGAQAYDSMQSAGRQHSPSQPGPPVTSGCWSQFSTLPQAQSICWCVRQEGYSATDKKWGWGGKDKEAKQGWAEPERHETGGGEATKRGERKQDK